MARKLVNPNQLSFDFTFDTEEENKVAKHSQIIEMIIDDLTTASVAEIAEIAPIIAAYQPIIPESDINDADFSARQWINDRGCRDRAAGFVRSIDRAGSKPTVLR